MGSFYRGSPYQARALSLSFDRAIYQRLTDFVVFFRDIIFSPEVSASLSSAAQQKRIGEAKVIAAKAEVRGPVKSCSFMRIPDRVVPGGCKSSHEAGCRHSSLASSYADPSIRSTPDYGQVCRFEYVIFMPQFIIVIRVATYCHSPL